jgi:putative sigma-54 modulation protein
MTQKTKFQNEGYTINITGKNVPISSTIQSYVMDKLSKIERFAPHILEILVTLDVQKLTHTACILIKFLHFKIKVQAATEDMYSAIDKAVDKLTKLIQKYKGKLQEHKNEHLPQIDMRVHVLREKPFDLEEANEEIEEETLKKEMKQYEFHKVVDKEFLPLKTLTQDEAVMKIELSGDHFLVYRGEEDQKLKVIYRREDENLGVIQLE